MINRTYPMTNKNAKPSKKNAAKRIGAFDIETFGMGGHYLDGFTLIQGETPKRHKTFRGMFEELMIHTDVIWYAHNASGYEFSYIAELLRDLVGDVQVHTVVQGDSRIIGLKIKLGVSEPDALEIELRDSLALIPMSLAQGTAKFSKNKQKISGAINWEVETYDPANPQHVEYARADVESLVDMIAGFSSLIQQAFGCGIKMSAASTALNCWLATLPDDTKYWRTKAIGGEETFRDAYYGGFVFPGRTIEKTEDVTSIDRNAAYAAAMSGGVPYGEYFGTSEYLPSKPGIYKVEATTPAGYTGVPCLPYRSPHGLLWPTGTFVTDITSVEYEYALSKGYTLKVLGGVYWEELAYPFKEFIETCEELERDPSLKEVAKLMRNSVYGKFGAKPESKEYMIDSENQPEGYSEVINPLTGEATPSLYSKTTRNTANYIMPHWAAFITARQRVWLFQTIDAVGSENVVYCDTDSVKAKTPAVNAAIEKGLIQIKAGVYGACKVDEEYTWFQCLGPKVYHGALTNGELKQRAKGLQKKQLTQEYYSELFEEIKTGQNENFSPEIIEERRNKLKKMTIEGTNNAMAMFKNNSLEIAAKRTRRITDIRNSKTWKLAGSSIIPPHVLDPTIPFDFNNKLNKRIILINSEKIEVQDLPYEKKEK